MDREKIFLSEIVEKKHPFLVFNKTFLPKQEMEFNDLSQYSSAETTELLELHYKSPNDYDIKKNGLYIYEENFSVFIKKYDFPKDELNFYFKIVLESNVTPVPFLLELIKITNKADSFHNFNYKKNDVDDFYYMFDGKKNNTKHESCYIWKTRVENMNLEGVNLQAYIYFIIKNIKKIIRCVHYHSNSIKPHAYVEQHQIVSFINSVNKVIKNIDIDIKPIPIDNPNIQSIYTQ